MEKDKHSVYEIAVKFMLENKIVCGEGVYQCDRVIKDNCDISSVVQELLKKASVKISR